MSMQSPFLDVKSFVEGEINPNTFAHESSGPAFSPFLLLYESEDDVGLVDRETEEYTMFLNQLYDEEFNEALSALVDEATTIYETQFRFEVGDPQSIGYQAERLLTQHFTPLIAAGEALFTTLTGEYGQRDPNSLTESEVEAFIDRYQLADDLAPDFEEFFGKIKKAAKKALKKGLDMAKKGVSAAAKMGLKSVLEKLKALVKPLLKNVIQTAIGKIPPQYQPLVKKIADSLPFLKELDENTEFTLNTDTSSDIANIQYEFNRQIANLVFAPTLIEQDLEVARVLADPHIPARYPQAELDRAREHFIAELRDLKEGEDPTPHIENFVTAILPALRLGIKLIGRKKVVDYLAKLLAKLTQKLVGPQYAPALSQIIVDVGLRLLQLEVLPDEGERAAASAVAATVEETVRRVATAPDYILTDLELLEGFTLEAFEQAAAANLPPILSPETYRKRPDLAEARKLQGTWVMMPQGQRKRYKKYSRKISTRLTPHKVSNVETFGDPLQEFLEEQLGIAPGEEIEAFVHLYEALPDTRLSDIARLETHTSGLGFANGYQQFHPLTAEAATLLLGEPDMAHEVHSQSRPDLDILGGGQRFYYLEVPGKRPLMVPGPKGQSKMRRRTQVRLTFDFPKNEIRVYVFLSEIRAQEIAVKLRGQHAHIGTIATRLRQLVKRGLHSALKSTGGRFKIIHESVTPELWAGALRGLPALVPQALLDKLTEWITTGLAEHFKQHGAEFIKAADDTADGVTLTITLGNPPGFPQLRQVFKGKGLSSANFKLIDGKPATVIKTTPGYTYE